MVAEGLGYESLSFHLKPPPASDGSPMSLSGSAAKDAKGEEGTAGRGGTLEIRGLEINGNPLLGRGGRDAMVRVVQLAMLTAGQSLRCALRHWSCSRADDMVRRYRGWAAEAAHGRKRAVR